MQEFEAVVCNERFYDAGRRLLSLPLPGTGLPTKCTTVSNGPELVG